VTAIGLISALERNARLRYTLTAAAFLVILFARRSKQILYPQVWDEEGRLITDVVQFGPLSIVHHLNGYLVIPTKLVVFVAMLFPLPAFPFIATIIAWACMIAVLLAIAYSPTMLKGGPLLALAVLLVPSDAEVFGVPLYTFWWATLLLFVAALWRPNANAFGWRVAFAIIGALSSPLVVIVAPLAIVLALRRRTKVELIFAATCVACALIQIIFILSTAVISGQAGITNLAAFISIFPKFVGTYAIGNIWVHVSALRPLALAAFAIIPFVLVAASLVRDRQNRTVVLALTYLWLGSILLSCARADPGILDPANAGPRYFFYPYILEGWLLLQFAFSSGARPLRWTALAVLVLAAFNVLPILNRSHDDLDWQTHVAQCEATPAQTQYAIPIQLAGSAGQTLYLGLTGSQCRRLGRFGLLGLLLPP
jgi:hypothetical protein